MIHRFEGSFLGFDQTDLFFQTWTGDNPRGAIVITHGLAEHSDCYHALAKVLAQEDWQVFAWDLRGHGRSEGKRGFAHHVSEFEHDLAAFVANVVEKKKNAQGPLILLGHSMGGLVTLRYILNEKSSANAVVLSSPALGLSVKIPMIKEKIAIIANTWAPTITLHNEIKYTDLTRDEKMIKSYEKDTLRHDKISPGIFLSMTESFATLHESAKQIQIPILMQIAGAERIVSSDASREFFAKLTNKKSHLEEYSESMHEIYNDLDREKAIADLKKFINPYLGAST